MANKTTIAFSFTFFGDGASTSVSIDLTTGPVFFSPPVSGSITPLFASAPADVPLANMDCAGLTIVSRTLLLGVLTLNFSSAPTNGSLYTVNGYATF